MRVNVIVVLVGLCAVLPGQVKVAEKQPADALHGPPFVNATSWAIADAKTGRFLHGNQADKPMPMASTTKVMTALLVMKLAAADPRVFDEIVKTSRFAGTTRGSSARIHPGDQIKVSDLLYGLLLPSGNDAANAIAQHFGGRFEPPVDPKSIPWNTRSAERDQVWMNFVAEMSREGKRLKMTNTRFVNPHGLDAEHHHASARDLLVLARAAMAHPTFRRIVGTREYRGPIITAAGARRTETWRSTNQLLGIEGYHGVKTGTTSKAGACLISNGTRGASSLFIVVLHSTNRGGRYVDTRNLYRWAFNQHLAGGK